MLTPRQHHGPSKQTNECCTEQQIRSLLNGVYDPELPGITIGELGILRDFDIQPETITVYITPTWSGCPALDEIERNVRAALIDCQQEIVIEYQLSPPWSSDWLTDSAREKLKKMNIARPLPASDRPQTAVIRRSRIITCPRCHNRHTTEVSECGSTACKALYTCPRCQNIFEYFKDI